MTNKEYNLVWRVWWDKDSGEGETEEVAIGCSLKDKFTPAKNVVFVAFLPGTKKFFICNVSLPFCLAFLGFMNSDEWPSMCSSSASQATQCICVIWLTFVIGVKNIRDQCPWLKQEDGFCPIANSWDPSWKSISHPPFVSSHLVKSSKG